MRARRVALLAAVLAEAPTLPIDRHVAARYGELCACAGRRSGNDLWIAATALAHDFTLIAVDEQLASLPLVRSTLVNQ
jgi:tRNA(fMet)-specific endonuclease VapC